MTVRWLARAAFLLSGVAGLTFEIVWIRALGLSLGGTTLAIATTTAAYMGGLALGSHFGGRIADRLRRPLAMYGIVEIGLAVVGLFIPFLCQAIPRLDGWLLDPASSGASRGVFRFLVATAVLIVPTTAMGMTLPVLARAVTARLDHVGRQVGSLYAINIIGALIGAACSGFWWIPTLGLTRTNLVAVGIDFSLGIVAVAAGFALKPLVTAAPKEVLEAEPALRPGTRSLVAMLALTGATAMALQVLWSRALGTALGPSTYAFTAIVCAYLAGLGLGSAVAAWLSDRINDMRAALAGVLVYTGLMTLFGIFIVDDLPALLRSIVVDPNLTMGGLFRTEFALAALSVFPATFGMGAIFPLTLTAVVGSANRVGSAVGKAYAINTMGSIFGSFAGIFVLLPLFGVELGMRIAALAYPVAAIVLLAKPTQLFQVGPRYAVIFCGVLALAAGMLWPSWNVSLWTSGLFRLSTARSYYADGPIETSPLIFHRDGLVATVTVEEEEGVRWIKVDGKIDGSSEGDMPTQVLSGLLPMLLHKQPDNVVVIGCGSCVTVGAVLETGIEKATLVELEPAVLEAAKLFAEVNYSPWEHPKLTIVEDDGRNFLMRSPKNSFDLIISEPSNPWMTGAASLFTQEFFRIAEQRLSEQGMFLQWLQIYELAPERIASVLRTFQSVFPHVLVFSADINSNDLLMIGTREPLHLDWSTFTQRAASVTKLLDQAEVSHPAHLLARLLFDDSTIVNEVMKAPFNTDDNALIEFGAPRDLLQFAEADPELPFLHTLSGTRVDLVAKLSPAAMMPETLLPLTEGYLTQGMLADAQAALDLIGPEDMLTDPQQAQRQELQHLLNLFLQADTEKVLRQSLMDADADYAKAARLVLQDQEEGMQKALELFNESGNLHQRSAAHALLYAYIFYRQRQYYDAETALQFAASAEPKDASVLPAVTYYQARNDLNRGFYDRAVHRMRTYRGFVNGGLSHESK